MKNLKGLSVAENLGYDALMSRLSKFLSEHVRGHGKQADLARATGVNTVTAGRWLKGSVPAFDKVILIADYMGLDRREAVSMTESLEYMEVYERLTAKSAEQIFYRQLSLDSAQVSCHRKLQDIMNVGGVLEQSICLNVDAIWEHLQRYRRQQKRKRENTKE